MVEKRFGVFKHDWSLNRSGPADEARHNEKIKEVIRDRLPEIISQGDIITADPQTKKIIKIPMNSLELPRFRHGENQGGFGTGPGGEGDVIGRGKSGGRPGLGDGEDKGGAGDGPGVEYYGVEMSLEELKEMVYADFGLPYLEPKKAQRLTEEVIKFNRPLHKPRQTNIDIRRTILENMKRTAKETGEVKISDFENEDIWVRTWNVERERATNALLLPIADISGSMGEFERYATRAFCWWMSDALRHIYPQVEIAWIVHDSEAEEVTEEAFFTRGSSGGTKCSTGIELARQLILSRYPPDLYNIYPIHFSDGDNWDNDNIVYLAGVNELLRLGVNQYAYVQIGRSVVSDLLSILRQEVKHERFHGLKITNKAEIYPALKSIFSAERAEK